MSLLPLSYSSEGLPQPPRIPQPDPVDEIAQAMGDAGVTEAARAERVGRVARLQSSAACTTAEVDQPATADGAGARDCCSCRNLDDQNI